MSTRQPEAGLASSTKRLFPGPPSAPIPPLPTRSYTEPLKTVSFPKGNPQHSVSMAHLSSERVPLVNPRKARRHCTDFGFKRETSFRPLSMTIKTSQPTPDDASITTPEPTPPGTFSSSGSDASSLHDLQFDFPQPPPTVPVLRRMKSSPLFSLGEGSTREFSKKRWGALSVSHGHTQPPSIASNGTAWCNPGATDSLSDLGAEISISCPFSDDCDKAVEDPESSVELEIQGESLMMEASDISFSHWPGVFSCHASAREQCPPFAFPSASKSSFTLEPGHLKCDPLQTSGQADLSPSPHLSPLPPSKTLPPSHRQVSKMRSLKFAPGCSSSLDRLDISIEKPKPQNSLFRGRSISMNFHRKRHSSVITTEPSVGRTETSDSSCCFLPDASNKTSRDLRSHRSTASGLKMQVNRDGGLNPQGSRDRPAGLTTPFLHRPVRNMPARPCHSSEFESAPSPGLKSFIEMTPEQINCKGIAGHRGKVKKLLARASQVFDLKNLRKVGSW